MKKFILLILFINFHLMNGQVSSDSSSIVRTEIFWLDLCRPQELKTIIKSEGRERFEVNWKNTLSFGLINTNQFKYDYKINSVPFASFVDTSYASFANSIKSSVDLVPDPFFVFEIKNKPPNKVKYLELSSELEKLKVRIEEDDTRLNQIEKAYEYDFSKNKL